MKKRPTFVLFVERPDRQPYVWLFKSLEEAEGALRCCATNFLANPPGDQDTIWRCPRDDEDAVRLLAQMGVKVRLFVITHDSRGRLRPSAVVTPFARKTASSVDQLGLPQV
jgi:hypothetical protein